MKANKHKELERAIRLVWTSLESHLPWTYKKSSEGKKFHRKCVKEYAETIKIIADNL